MSPEVLSGAIFNGVLVAVVGWLINDKLKTMAYESAERYHNLSARVMRIEDLFFKYGKPDNTD